VTIRQCIRHYLYVDKHCEIEQLVMQFNSTLIDMLIFRG